MFFKKSFSNHSSGAPPLLSHLKRGGGWAKNCPGPPFKALKKGTPTGTMQLSKCPPPPASPCEGDMGIMPNKKDMCLELPDRAWIFYANFPDPRKIS